MIDHAFWKGKRVFITGHTGFKGTWLSNILSLIGADITGYSLAPPTKPSLYEITETEKRIHSINGDIRDKDRLVSIVKELKPEIVFHLAAQPLVRQSYKQPVITYEINVMGTVNILEAIRNVSSVRSFVNVTTDKVYENKEWYWGYRENENLCGFDPYSNSKSCSELITYSYRNSFFNTSEAPAISTARSGNVIGGGDYAEDRIIPDCVRAAVADKDIIVRNPQSIRPYQHVLECLSGYILLAQKQYMDKTIAGPYNFGPDDESCINTGELVSLFCNAWQGAHWRVQSDYGPHEATFLKLDCSKAKMVLGWRPKWSIKTAVEKTVEFYECNTNIEKAKCLERQIYQYFNDK